jgi:hypothetical protein
VYRVANGGIWPKGPWRREGGITGEQLRAMPGDPEVVIYKDSAVPATVCDETRRQARERLALLDGSCVEGGDERRRALIQSGRRSTRSRVASARPEACHRQAHTREAQVTETGEGALGAIRPTAAVWNNTETTELLDDAEFHQARAKALA